VALSLKFNCFHVQNELIKLRTRKKIPPQHFSEAHFHPTSFSETVKKNFIQMYGKHVYGSLLRPDQEICSNDFDAPKKIIILRCCFTGILRYYIKHVQKNVLFVCRKHWKRLKNLNQFFLMRENFSWDLSYRKQFQSWENFW
jgi:hypothetical protein